MRLRERWPQGALNYGNCGEGFGAKFGSERGRTEIEESLRTGELGINDCET